MHLTPSVQVIEGKTRRDKKSSLLCFCKKLSNMKHRIQLLSAVLLLLFLFIIPTIQAKSMIEPCSSPHSCPSLLAYLLPYDLKVSQVAYLFQVNVSDILAANSIDPSTQSSLDQIFHAKTLLKVPVSCSCVDGIRRSVLASYAVRAADTLETISDGFGGLVSAEQIGSLNGVSGENPLMSGQSLRIPLPCVCFDNSNNGVATVYMSYVVQRGDSLGGIGARFGTTVTDLEAVNGLGQSAADAGDILAIPISACSSASLNWYNESLMVPNASYALTANNCIKCTCGPSDLNLRCLPSGMVPSCSHLQCKGSHLFVGDTHVKQTTIGCNVIACVYRGHSGGKIFRSLVNSSHVECPKASPPSSNSIVPVLTLCPSPAPYSALSPISGIASSPSSQQGSDLSSGGRLSSQPCLCLFLLSELILSFIL